MSLNLELHVLSLSSQLSTETVGTQILRHFGDFTAFIGQFVDLRLHGYDGYDTRVIETHPTLRGFELINGEEEALSTDRFGEPLRWFYADEIKKVMLPEEAGPYDRAMMAYLSVIAEEAPDTPIVIVVS